MFSNWFRKAVFRGDDVTLIGGVKGIPVGSVKSEIKVYNVIKKRSGKEAKINKMGVELIVKSILSWNVQSCALNKEAVIELKALLDKALEKMNL